MGELGRDTAVTKVDDGRYTARFTKDWEIWGPMGGVVASVALRAAGAESDFDRPASFFCHYLAVAAFDEDVDIAVSPLRQARTALSQRVEVTQAGKPILEATVWSIGDVEGLEHDVTDMPDVPPPAELKSIAELLSEDELAAGPPFKFWTNFETRPISFRRDWPPKEPVEPVWRDWQRFLEGGPWDADPWLDACRALVLVDVQSWPAASRAHAHKQPHGYIAPSLDLYVAFHHPDPASDWLLVDGHGPVAKDGLMAWNGRLWSESGKLIASGTGQLLSRRMR